MRMYEMRIEATSVTAGPITPDQSPVNPGGKLIPEPLNPFSGAG